MVEESLVVVTVCCDPIVIKEKSGFDFGRFGIQRMRGARMFSERLFKRLNESNEESSNVGDLIVAVRHRRVIDGSFMLYDVWRLRGGDLNPVFSVEAECDPKVVQFLNATAESVFKELVREYEVNEGF